MSEEVDGDPSDTEKRRNKNKKNYSKRIDANSMPI